MAATTPEPQAAPTAGAAPTSGVPKDRTQPLLEVKTKWTPAPTSKPLDAKAEPGKPPAEAKPGAPAEAKPEAKPEEKPAEPKEQVSKRFTILAKREAAVVKGHQELKAQQTQFQEAQKARAEEDKLWETDPLAAMQKRGWTYEKLTDLVLNEKKPTPEMVAKQAAKEEIEAERKRTQDDAKAKAEEQKKAAEAQHAETLKVWREEIKDFVSKNPDKYELIRLYDPEGEAVAATITENLRRTQKAGKPRLMSEEEACDLVEKFFQGEVEKAHKTKKFSTAKASPQPEGDGKPTEEAQPRTLTNDLIAGVTPPKTRLSREERIKKALAWKPA